MKKHALILSLLVLSLSAAGCSKKADTSTAEISTEAAAEDIDTEEEEIEEDSFSGAITAVNGNIITVKDDSDNAEKNFDISDAEVTRQFELTEGDLVYAEYYVEDKDPLTAIRFDVEESILAETMDPFAEGRIVDASADSITMEINGEDVTFATGNAYIVANNGVTVDSDAIITYIGELDDEPMAVKVVMADSADSFDAKINAFIGSVAEVDEEDGVIILESDNGDYFTFNSGDDLGNFSEGQTVKVIYDGKISDNEIDALEITAQ